MSLEKDAFSLDLSTTVRFCQPGDVEVFGELTVFLASKEQHELAGILLGALMRQAVAERPAFADTLATWAGVRHG